MDSQACKELLLRLEKTEQMLRAESERGRELESALQASRQRLKETEIVMTARLRRAQRMEAIGALASGIAHDFNNILAVVSGNCELSMMVIPEDSEAAPFLTAIAKAGDRARDLVQQILNFARHTNTEQKPTLIFVVIKEALKLLRGAIPSTIEFKLHICQDLHYVMADIVDIYQIFVKLCTNACHAMTSRGGVLTISLSKIELDEVAVHRLHDLRPGSYLKLDIRDTGEGIDAKRLKHLFDPSSDTPYNNDPIELSLCEIREITYCHHGDIVVRSRVGKGTTVSLFLPISASDLQTTSFSGRGNPLPGGSEHILFVDDESHLADFGGHFFSSLGYQVTPFDQSINALTAFKEQPNRYDLIITDLTMPHMSGNRLANEIAALRPDVPIILASGYPQHLIKASHRLNAVNVVIPKPFELSQLAVTVRGLLDDPVANPLN